MTCLLLEVVKKQKSGSFYHKKHALGANKFLGLIFLGVSSIKFIEYATLTHQPIKRKHIKRNFMKKISI